MLEKIWRAQMMFEKCLMKFLRRVVSVIVAHRSTAIAVI